MHISVHVYTYIYIYTHAYVLFVTTVQSKGVAAADVRYLAHCLLVLLVQLFDHPGVIHHYYHHYHHRRIL